jgi:hypothetical protein
MSRLCHTVIDVVTDTEGKPVSLLLPEDGCPRRVRVLGHLDYWREWIGILDGEPQRDVWLLETSDGICELHFLCYCRESDTPVKTGNGEWILARWVD